MSESEDTDKDNCQHPKLWELSARNGLRCPSCGKKYPDDADLGFAGYTRSGPSEWTLSEPKA